MCIEEIQKDANRRDLVIQKLSRRKIHNHAWYEMGAKLKVKERKGYV